MWNYIESDYQRYYGKQSSNGVKLKLKMSLKAISARNIGFTYGFWFRLGSSNKVLSFIGKLMHYRLSRRYGIQIPLRTSIGYGFYIGHGVGVVINGGTVIGNNCNISQFLSIGTNTNSPATIGDNVYIGPNVCIVEDVKIGNNVTIGAGAVVIKDIPENATAVGVPASTISFENPSIYI